MSRGVVKLSKSELFSKKHNISEQKIKGAVKKALEKLESKLDVYKESFPENISPDGNAAKYFPGPNNSWVSGMHTGVLILAYKLSGKQQFLDAAIGHLPTYRERINTKYKLQDHDVGFVFSPSCIALYKLTGNEEAKQIALEAAEYYYNTGYSKEGGFIMLSGELARGDNPGVGYRTMMDTLMNIGLLFWAGEETGDSKYTEAAKSQLKTTEKYLIREDGSSFHHYQFDINTHKPIRGLTFQGNRDESTWTRGHSWGIIGFPMAYGHIKDDMLLDLGKDVTYFMLNNLPDDLIPYWDFDFTTGSDEPKDTSAGIISVCGMMEALKYIDAGSEEYTIYKNASSMMLEAVIDRYTGDAGKDYDGLIWGVTGAKKFNIGIEDCAVYADYFYLEALLRYTDPDWEMLW
ncbi:MAG: glycoside hydrolase family 88 protein [Clostridia bacterium]|nr:glycoside hydrolase family 88 protein [Clostridia bacterium]